MNECAPGSQLGLRDISDQLHNRQENYLQNGNDIHKLFI